MSYAGPPIILDAVTYESASDGSGITIRGVAYLGVIARKSDGFTTLSVRKPGSSRAFNIETGRVLSIVASGRAWQPEAHASRWSLRAAEMRAFVEKAELEEWAKPYFDPRHEKYHRSRPRHAENTSAAAVRSEVVRASMGSQDQTKRPSIWAWLKRLVGGAS